MANILKTQIHPRFTAIRESILIACTVFVVVAFDLRGDMTAVPAKILLFSQDVWVFVGFPLLYLRQAGVPKESTVDELSQREKALVIGGALFTPPLTGLVSILAWRKKASLKARKANVICVVCYLVEIGIALLFVGAMRAFQVQYPQ